MNFYLHLHEYDSKFQNHKFSLHMHILTILTSIGLSYRLNKIVVANENYTIIYHRTTFNYTKPENIVATMLQYNLKKKSKP